jgi:hypothetical protein
MSAHTLTSGRPIKEFLKAAELSLIRNIIAFLFPNLVDDRQKSPGRGHFGLVRAFAAGQSFVKAAQVKSARIPGQTASTAADPRLNGSFREDRGGWAYIHLRGEARAIGFQHGWHLAAEIDDIIKTMAFYFEKTAKRKWAFFREAAERMFWPKLDRECQEEIEGIAEGVKACRPETAYDLVDLTALNSWLELAWY